MICNSHHCILLICSFLAIYNMSWFAPAIQELWLIQHTVTGVPKSGGVSHSDWLVTAAGRSAPNQCSVNNSVSFPQNDIIGGSFWSVELRACDRLLSAHIGQCLHDGLMMSQVDVAPNDRNFELVWLITPPNLNRIGSSKMCYKGLVEHSQGV